MTKYHIKSADLNTYWRTPLNAPANKRLPTLPDVTDMKKILGFNTELFLLFVFIAVVPRISHAQSNFKKDTIYYLVDTAKTSTYDRLITVQKNDTEQFYTINCPCLIDNTKPVFRCNLKKQTYIDATVFKSLKLTYLSELIEIVRKNDNKAFNDRFTIFFIEPLKQNYIKYKSFFLGGGITKID